MKDLEVSRPSIPTKAFRGVGIAVILVIMGYIVITTISLAAVILDRPALEQRLEQTKAQKVKYIDVQYEVKQMEIAQRLRDGCMRYYEIKAAVPDLDMTFPIHRELIRYKEFQKLKEEGKEEEARIMLDSIW